jgi:hypothetical protein
MAKTTKLRFTAMAGTLALVATLFTAPASFAGDRGDRWERDRSPRVERNYNRDRKLRAHKRAARRIDRRVDRRAVRRAVHYKGHRYKSHGYKSNRYKSNRRHKHGHRPVYRPVHRHDRHCGHRYGRDYGHRRGHSLAPVIAGIGLGILTYAIIDSHQRY